MRVRFSSAFLLGEPQPSLWGLVSKSFWVLRQCLDKASCNTSSLVRELWIFTVAPHFYIVTINIWKQRPLLTFWTTKSSQTLFFPDWGSSAGKMNDPRRQGLSSAPRNWAVLHETTSMLLSCISHAMHWQSLDFSVTCSPRASSPAGLQTACPGTCWSLCIPRALGGPRTTPQAPRSLVGWPGHWLLGKKERWQSSLGNLLVKWKLVQLPGFVGAIPCCEWPNWFLAHHETWNSHVLLVLL